MRTEMAGITYKLFGQKCQKCHFNTKKNQCAWFEHSHVAKEILRAKEEAEKGTPYCPRFARKFSVKGGIFSLSYGAENDKEDYFVEDAEA